MKKRRFDLRGFLISRETPMYLTLRLSKLDWAVSAGGLARCLGVIRVLIIWFGGRNDTLGRWRVLAEIQK